MTYDYECPRGHSFERNRPIAQRDAPTRCPTCRRAAQRVITSTALIYVAWRNTLGLGHSGQIVMPAVRSKQGRTV